MAADRFLLTLAFIAALLMVPVQVHADEDAAWLFSAGYSYMTGFDEIRSIYKANAREAGKDDDVYPLSIGVFFRAHRRIAGQLRAGAGVGPLMILIGDADHVQFPASLTFRHLFFQDAAHSPYVRAGVSWHFATGDDVSETRPGVLAGAGLEFFRKKRLRLGIEAAYDGAAVGLDRPVRGDMKTIRPGELTLSISAIF